MRKKRSDQEGEIMKKKTVREWAIFVIGVLMALFDIWALIFHSIPAIYFRSTYTFFTLILIYLLFPATKKNGKYLKKMNVLSWILLLASILTTVYAFFEMERIELSQGLKMNNMDQICAAICIVVVLEACRRTTGNALPTIAIIFLLYAKFGQYIPGMLGHTGYSIKRILVNLYSYSGIFGTALNTVATYVTMFMIFAAFLERTGAGDAFLELSMSLVGYMRGGPAKVAVVSSALFGSISGSAVANVAATGSFTIPLMKRTGYKPKFAAAVEAVASTGGQIMPPVMASSAFLMADYLGVPYTTVVKAAILPALIYFTICWVTIDREAAVQDLKIVDRKELEPLKSVLKRNWLYLTPVVLLIVLLTVFKISSIRCAFYSMIAATLICLFDKNEERRMKPIEIFDVLAGASKSVVSVGAACACAGIVVGCIGLTGIGQKISTLIINLSGGNAFIGLLLAMCTAIIFGMGLPTAVSYILCVSVLIPPLVAMGIPAIAAHLFILYFACLSGITPPVALAAYTGASIAGSKPIETAFEATKLASVVYFLPYMFAFNQSYLLYGTATQVALAILVGITCCFAVSSCVQGWMFGRLSPVWRVLYGISAVIMIYPRRSTDIIGIVLFAALTVVLYVLSKKEKVQKQST